MIVTPFWTILGMMVAEIRLRFGPRLLCLIRHVRLHLPHCLLRLPNRCILPRQQGDFVCDVSIHANYLMETPKLLENERKIYYDYQPKLVVNTEIVNALGFAFHFARPPIPSPAKRDEDRIPFELFLEYTANWENANLKRSARGARRAARIGFERAFLAKRKRIYQ